MVGLASGTTSRSIANFLRPVTMSWASMRPCGVPSSVKSLAGLSSTDVSVSVVTADGLARSPMFIAFPARLLTTPPVTFSSSAGTFMRFAAVRIICCFAIAAAVRTGMNRLRIEFEPPVSWLSISSGRASARVTVTFSSGRSSSSAIIIATVVVMPWPTSHLGTANDTVPSVLTWMWIRFAVGAAAMFCRSPRSYVSGSCGGDGWRRPRPAAG